MIIPNSAAYLEYEAAGTPGGETFVAPGLNPSGLSYSGALSSIKVAVNGDPLANHLWSLNSSGSVVISTTLVAGDKVEIWRETPVGESLVDYPVPNRYTPLVHNKSLKQIFLCLQELWGGLKWLLGYTNTKIAETVENLEGQLGDLKENLEGQLGDLEETFNNWASGLLVQLAEWKVDTLAYINSAIAAGFSAMFEPGTVVTWSTTVAAGSTKLPTPFRFDRGMLIVGGSVYDLQNPAHALLGSAGTSNTTIYFNEPIGFDTQAILVAFATSALGESSGLAGETQSYVLNPGEDSLEIPRAGITRGTVAFAGKWYDLGDPTQVALAESEELTIVTFLDGGNTTQVAQETVVLIFDDGEPLSVEGITHSASMTAGQTSIVVPYRFSGCVWIVGGSVYNSDGNTFGGGMSLVAGESSTTLTLDSPVVADMQTIVIILRA